MQARYTGIAATFVALSLIAIAITSTGAVAPSNEHFEQTWARTDRPVADGAVARTWMWGPEANDVAFYEEYVDAPSGERLVQYFDKSRMEITDPNGDPSSVWYVTNGLLVVEMMDGRMQMGDNSFISHPAAEVPVAGDGDDLLGPTYATFAGLRDAPALPDGATITHRVNRDGNVTTDPSLASHDVTTAYRVQVPNIDHQVASPFWSFMNLSGTVYENGGMTTAPLFLSPFYATGYPITEPYWADVKVAGTYRLVLMQCFERRCLTYTPGNPEGFLTEAGNVGLHYYTWRYGRETTPTSTATATQTGTVTATASPTNTPTQTATYTPTNTPTNTPTYTPTSTPTEVPGANGRVYVSDLNIDRVQVFDLTGTFLFSFGDFGSGPGEFDGPWGIAIDTQQGWVYVADSGNHRVQKFDLDGNYITAWGTFGQDAGEFGSPKGVAVGPSGRVYVTDAYHRVQRFESSGAFIQEWGELGTGDGQFSQPRGLTVSEFGRVFVVDKDNHRIQKFLPTGDWLATWGGPGAGSGQYDDPEFITSDTSENLYVADSFNNRVVKTDTDGNVEAIWTGGSEPFAAVYGIAIAEGETVAGQDLLYVADIGYDRVSVISSSDGSRLFSFGADGNADVELDTPLGIAVYVEATP